MIIRSAWWLLRWGVAGLFVYAGFIKALAPTAFVTDVDHFGLLSQRWAWVVGLYLPYLEIACGLALCFGAWARPAAGVLLVLCMVFAVALVSAWWRGLDIACGCFGAGSSPDVGWALARDGVLLVVLGLIFWRSGAPARLPSSVNEEQRVMADSVVD